MVEDDNDLSSFKTWQHRISVAKEVQRAYREDWNRWRTLYLFGTDAETIRLNRASRVDTVRVNQAHAYVRSILPRIIFKIGKIFAEPRREGDEESAAAVSFLMNYLLDETNSWREIRLSVVDAVIYGCGFIKLGFDSEYGIDPKTIDRKLDVSSQLAEAEEFNKAVRLFAGLQEPPVGVKKKPFGGSRTSIDEYNTNVIREYPWVLRVSPYDILVDPDAKSLNDAKWVAHRIYRPARDVRDDKRYLPIRSQVKGGNPLEPFDSEVQSMSPDTSDPVHPGNADILHPSEADLVRSVQRDQSAGYMKLADGSGGRMARAAIWEIWDKETDHVFTYSAELTDWLRAPVANPFEMEGFPFVMLGFNEVPDRFYPKSDFADLEPQQLELNEIRQFSLQWFHRMSKFIIAAPKGVLTEKLKEQITGRNPFIVVDLEAQATPDTVQPLNLGTFDPAIYTIEERIRRDLKDQVGLGDEQQGNSVPGVTATGVAAAEQATGLRVDDKRTFVELFVRDVSRKLLQITRQFFPPKVAINIGGEAGTKWLVLAADQIRREYDVRIEVGSTTKPNDEVRRRQLVELINVLAPLGQPGPLGIPTVPINWPELLKHVLYAYGIEDPSKILRMDPMQAAQSQVMLADAAMMGGGGAMGGAGGAPASGGGGPSSEDVGGFRQSGFEGGALAKGSLGKLAAGIRTRRAQNGVGK